MRKIVPLNRKSAVLIAKCEKEINDAMDSARRMLIAALYGPIATVSKPTKKRSSSKARKISKQIIKAHRR